MTKIIDGKLLAAEIRAQVAADVQQIAAQGGTVRFDAILVGDNPASQIYVRNKQRACEQVGIQFQLHHLPADCDIDSLVNLIRDLSDDDAVNGILLQLPLPAHLADYTSQILNTIRISKDVDGLHVTNTGRLASGITQGLLPCTAQGVLYAIHSVCPEIAGKNITMVGRSHIVGLPTSLLLQSQDATVTVCHKLTRDLAAHTRQADIIVVAAGCAGLIKPEMVKDGAIVIDVGINRLPDGKLVGDVDFDGVAPKTAAITPVPGGIGPLTIAFLLKNIITAYRWQHNL